MAIDYTTTQLVTLIKTKGLIPSSQVTYLAQDFINLANDELSIGVVPFLMKNRSEYFVTTQDVPIVNGTSSYSIPTRAIGGKLRELSYIDSAGNVYDIPQIEEEELPFFNQVNSSSSNYLFYFQGNNVILVPQPTQSVGSIRFSYYQRPNQLVATTDAGQITAINGNTITLASVPSSFSTATPLDFIKSAPGFDCRAIDQTPTVTGGSTLTFTSLPSTLAVNDWVALAGQSPIPQIPYDLFPLLIQRTVVKVMEGLGDAQGVQTAQGKLKEIEDACEHLISPRSDGNPKKLINRFSPLRAQGTRGFTRY